LPITLDIYLKKQKVYKALLRNFMLLLLNEFVTVVS
jgi:hypothetical protein